jgi:hypothetical protein
MERKELLDKVMLVAKVLAMEKVVVGGLVQLGQTLLLQLVAEMAVQALHLTLLVLGLFMPGAVVEVAMVLAHLQALVVQVGAAMPLCTQQQARTALLIQVEAEVGGRRQQAVLVL